MRNLPRLFGGQEIFAEAEAYCMDEQSAATLSYLKALFDDLCELNLGDKVMVDLGLVQRNDYYTDIVFSAYVEDCGDAVLSGGRYDNLLASFDAPMPAIGFAINVDALTQVLIECGRGPKTPNVEILVHGDEGYEIRALRHICLLYTSQMVRAAIPNMEAVALIPAIKQSVSIPLVADIHFDYRLALAAVDAGVDKIRINPGNIGGKERVRAVAKACQSRGIPIRIGVNSGSLEKELLAKYGSPTPEALCESALYHASLLEEFDFTDIVISIKSSNVDTMIQSYQLVAEQCSYPLHLGVTEAGTERMGIIKMCIRDSWQLPAGLESLFPRFELHFPVQLLANYTLLHL